MALDLTCADISVFYKLEEAGASDVRADSKGVAHLTPTNSVLNTAGIINNAALFNGSSFLSRASIAALTMAGIFSAAGWANLATSATQGLAWKGITVSALVDYEWRINTSGSNLLFAVTDGTGGHQGVVTTSQTWSTGTPFFWSAWYDGIKLYCDINDSGSPSQTAYTFGSWAGGHPFALGASGNGGSVISNGSWLDETMVLNGYAFTANDLTALYNGGAGVGYDSICIPPGVVQWMPAIRELLHSSEFVGVRYV